MPGSLPMRVAWFCERVKVQLDRLDEELEVQRALPRSQLGERVLERLSGIRMHILEAVDDYEKTFPTIIVPARAAKADNVGSQPDRPEFPGVGLSDADRYVGWPRGSLPTGDEQDYQDASPGDDLSTAQ